MYYLPWWMQWAQAIGIGVISAAGVFIAYKQSRIATAKLNLDLYDRRFKVFEATRAFVTAFLTAGKYESDEFVKFMAATSEAVFLFDEEVPQYLGELRGKIYNYRKVVAQLKGAADDKQRGELADQLAATETAMSEEFQRLIKLFKPYLKLGNI
jgi:hypothetical protein